MRAAAKLFKKNAPVPDTKNISGYPAFTKPIEERFVQLLLTNVFGQTFYASKDDLIAESETVHAEMLARDPAFVAKALVYARQRGYMRTQPIFGLVKLARRDTEAFRAVFDKVVLTPNDLADFTALLAADRDGTGGSAVKKTAGRWLSRNFLSGLDGNAEYWTIKYGSENKHGTFTLRDMFRLYHPRPPGKGKTDKVVPLASYIMNKMENIDFSGLPKIEQFEILKQAQTDAQKVEAITLGRLPHEVASSFAGSSAEVWDAIVPQMPIFALLRNLATIERHGVADKQRAHIQGMFADKNVIKNSKILPFRFLEASKHVNTSWLKDALRDGLENSFENIPDISGKTVIALDNSGSMGGFIDTAAVFAIAAFKKSGLNGMLYTFDDRLEVVPVSMRDSILTQAAAIKARGGTDHSLVMKKLIKDGNKVDNIIYITDETQNNGSPLFKLIEDYRNRVNNDVKVFIVDVAPYTSSGSLLSHSDPNVFYIYGWSDDTLRFIGMNTQGWASQVSAIKREIV